MRALGLALTRHIHDRDKLRGPVAKHGVATKSEDVDFLAICLDMLPNVARVSADNGIVLNRVLDVVPVLLRHYVEQGHLQRLSGITVMNDRRVVHGQEFQGFGIGIEKSHIGTGLPSKSNLNNFSAATASVTSLYVPIQRTAAPR